MWYVKLQHKVLVILLIEPKEKWCLPTFWYQTQDKTVQSHQTHWEVLYSVKFSNSLDVTLLQLATVRSWCPHIKHNSASQWAPQSSVFPSYVSSICGITLILEATGSSSHGSAHWDSLWPAITQETTSPPNKKKPRTWGFLVGRHGAGR